jgi:hypothetical protein
MPRHQGPVMTTHLAKPADLIGFPCEVGTTAAKGYATEMSALPE